jgi:hypothetical protein
MYEISKDPKRMYDVDTDINLQAGQVPAEGLVVVKIQKFPKNLHYPRK